jgi:hypothetical protein
MWSLNCLTQEGEGTSVASTGGFHLIKLITPQVVKECMSVLKPADEYPKLLWYTRSFLGRSLHDLVSPPPPTLIIELNL